MHPWAFSCNVFVEALPVLLVSLQKVGDNIPCVFTVAAGGLIQTLDDAVPWLVFRIILPPLLDQLPSEFISLIVNVLVNFCIWASIGGRVDRVTLFADCTKVCDEVCIDLIRCRTFSELIEVREAFHPSSSHSHLNVHVHPRSVVINILAHLYKVEIPGAQIVNHPCSQVRAGRRLLLKHPDQKIVSNAARRVNLIQIAALIIRAAVSPVLEN